MLVLTLPMPPSVNTMFANNKGKGRGRYPTKRYKDWKFKTALAVAGTQRPEPLDGDVRVLCTFGPRDKRRDLDNCLKAIGDFLQEHTYIVNDSQIVEWNAKWGEVEGAHVEVWAV